MATFDGLSEVGSFCSAALSGILVILMAWKKLEKSVGNAVVVDVLALFRSDVFALFHTDVLALFHTEVLSSVY